LLFLKRRGKQERKERERERFNDIGEKRDE
jgi:hypothetical protein